MRLAPQWLWWAFPAVVMSLGWGLRGSIGGGPLGAMIPGAMTALALCLLAGRESDAGRIAGLAAIGVGFGGQETYGQTVGLSLQPETFRWAILGFGLKGAAWGLLGGAFLGIGFDRTPWKRAITAFAVMVSGTAAGWLLIDHPKLLYFSNRLDRPREEVWAGLLLGGLLMLVWLRARVPAWFALYGAIGGGIGFAFGAALQPWGRSVWEAMPLGWWKGMELTFGALLGAAYGLCAWKFRKELGETGGEAAQGTGALQAIGLAAIAIALAIGGELSPLRFGYTVAGAILAGMILRSTPLGWQTAITATYAAFCWDLVEEQKLFSATAGWVGVAVSTPVAAMIVARHAEARRMLLLLTWVAVGVATRYVWPPGPWAPEPVTMLAVFTFMAAGMTLAARRWKPHLSALH